jgi:hypothetical protein
LQLESRSIEVRTADTDVVVLAMPLFKKLNIEHRWLHFGVNAFFQHPKRAIHQDVHFWSKCLVGQIIANTILASAVGVKGIPY